GVPAVITSRSLLGVAWQNSVGPSPSTSSVTVAGSPARNAHSSGPRRSRTQPSSGGAAVGSENAAGPSGPSGLSQLPRTQYSSVPAERSSPRASTGWGPSATSPPTTIASAPTPSTSASTAPSASAIPWTSYRAATRTQCPV